MCLAINKKSRITKWPLHSKQKDVYVVADFPHCIGLRVFNYLPPSINNIQNDKEFKCSLK